MSQSPMKGIFTLILILALIAGVISARVFKKVLIEPGQNQVPVTTGPKVQALVAKQDIRAGAEFTARNIQFMLFPEAQVPREAIFDTTGILGQKAVGDIPKDSFLTLFDIRIQQNQEEVYIAPGYSPVPVRVENINAGDGSGDISDYIDLEDILKPGDKVEVRGIRSSVVQENDSKNAVPKISTKVLVASAIVYKVATESKTDGSVNKKVAVVSLILDKKNSETLRKEAALGKICLAALGTEGGSKNKKLTEPVANAAPIMSLNPVNSNNTTNNNNSYSNDLGTNNLGFNIGINMYDGQGQVSAKKSVDNNVQPKVQNPINAKSIETAPDPAKAGTIGSVSATTAPNVNANFNMILPQTNTANTKNTAKTNEVTEKVGTTEAKEKKAPEDILGKSTVNYPVLPKTSFNPIVPQSNPIEKKNISKNSAQMTLPAPENEAKPVKTIPAKEAEKEKPKTESKVSYNEIKQVSAFAEYPDGKKETPFRVRPEN